PEYQFERFKDLQLGMRVWVWVRRTEEWRSAVVYRIRDHQSPGRGKVAVIRDTSGSSFLYEDSWGHDRTRIRRVEPALGTFTHSAKAGEVAEIDMKMLRAGVVTPQEVASERFKTTRQAAKSMNFGTSNQAPPVDGMTPDAILRVFIQLQREEISPLVSDPT